MLKVAYVLRKIQTSCVNNSFLGLRVRNFQGIVFIRSRAYGEILIFDILNFLIVYWLPLFSSPKLTMGQSSNSSKNILFSKAGECTLASSSYGDENLHIFQNVSVFLS